MGDAAADDLAAYTARILTDLGSASNVTPFLCLTTSGLIDRGLTGLRQLHPRGRERVSWIFTFTNAAYNFASGAPCRSGVHLTTDRGPATRHRRPRGECYSRPFLLGISRARFVATTHFSATCSRESHVPWRWDPPPPL